MTLVTRTHDSMTLVIRTHDFMTLGTRTHDSMTLVNGHSLRLGYRFNILLLKLCA